MPRAWISELDVPQTVREIYLVKRKALLTSPSNGRPYLSLVLTDRSGDVDARVWDKAEQLGSRFDEDGFVRVDGRTVRYQGRIQLHVSSVEPVEAETLSADDFMPRTSMSMEELFGHIQALLETVGNPHLRAVLDRILADEIFAEAYRRAPGGKTIHHARLGGLMEHNLTMCRLIDGICPVYEEAMPGLVDRDLLITAALLHDCGKTLELSTERHFDYTDAGRLVGHVVLGYELVSRHMELVPDMPPALALHLKHLLLSHHGELEHGAPKRPKTVEAWILHYVDILDCRVAQTAELVQGLPAGEWTAYQRLYDRYFWRGHSGGTPPTGTAHGSPSEASAKAASDATSQVLQDVSE